jgi:hypothetical protein
MAIELSCNVLIPTRRVRSSGIFLFLAILLHDPEFGGKKESKELNDFSF